MNTTERESMEKLQASITSACNELRSLIISENVLLAEHAFEMLEVLRPMDMKVKRMLG